MFSPTVLVPSGRVQPPRQSDFPALPSEGSNDNSFKEARACDIYSAAHERSRATHLSRTRSDAARRRPNDSKESYDDGREARAHRAVQGGIRRSRAESR